MQERKTLTTVTELRSLSEACNLFIKFAPNFARTTPPLSKHFGKARTKDLGPFEEEELQALDTLKKNLILPLVHYLLQQNGYYTLDADACDKQVE